MQLGNKWRSLKEWFADFSDHSTIHGVIYIGDGQLSWFERIFWIIGFAISSLCCGKLINDAWNIDPIIISFTDKPTPIWQMPFPAVTICPNVFAKAEHLTTITMDDLYREPFQVDQFTAHDQKKLLAMNSVCSLVSIKGFDKNDTCNDCLERLREIRIPPEELFVECKFLNQVIDCKNAFRESLTDIGVCYTFNSLENHRSMADNHNVPETPTWNVDYGYTPNASLNTYPRRALGASQKFGLSIVLKLNRRDFGFACQREPGFFIELHMPSEIAMFSTKYFNPTYGDTLVFVVKPKILTTSGELRKYPIKKRKCHFSNERPLRYFKQYTLDHCEMNCKIRSVLRKCGCLLHKFSQYRNRLNVCGPSKQKCVDYQLAHIYDNNFFPCGCLPACSSIAFGSEITGTEFNMSKYPDDLQKGYAYNKFTFYLKETQVITSQRTELYGTTDFLANCGGILGLCLGVSVMSLLEILYFCTIRLYFHLRRNEDTNRPIAILVEEFQYFRYKKKHVLRTLKDLAADYSSRSTLQGVKYVADSAISLFERFWWSIVISISIYGCGSLMYDLYGRYNDSPLIISFANEEIPIDAIPFPAITVCPQAVSKSVNEYYDHFQTSNKSLYDHHYRFIEHLTAIAVVCDPELFGHLDPENRTNCDHCFGDLEYFTGGMHNTLLWCAQYSPDTCSDMFIPTMTERGVCYTFNSLEVFRDNDTDRDAKPMIDEWTLDNGFVSDTSDDPLPRPGTDKMLELNLFAYNFMNDGICKGPIKGFQVYLHLPNEAAQISKHYYLVPYRNTVYITISPHMIIPAPELRDFPVEKRQCYYDDERYLRFFRYYTQNNCEDECLANLTIVRCNCYRFYLPDILELKVCGIGEIQCIEEVIREYSDRERSTKVHSACDCLPTCTTISFDAEINQKSLKIALDQLMATNPAFYSQISVASLKMMFRDVQFVPLKRTQLYGQTEFFANCGALMGLFLGFSLISVLELFYFCTIRLFCNLKEKLF